MSETITRQIEGVLSGVNFGKDGWKEYAVDVGRQYPVKLSTKLPDLQTAAEGTGGAKAVWTFTESDGAENPHKPGTFYKNRRLSKVEVGGTLDPAFAGQAAATNTPAGGGNQQRSMPDDRAESIERQVIVKAVLGMGSWDDPDAMFVLMDRLDDWMGRIRGGQQTKAADPVPDRLPPEGLQGEGGDELDDIPFLPTIDGLGN